MGQWRASVLLPLLVGTLFSWEMWQYPIGAAHGATWSTSLSWRSVASQPLEKRISGVTLRIVQGAKKTVTASAKTVSRAALWWRRHLGRAVAFVLLAVMIGLADRNLLRAWREEGLSAVATYVPMMLYVYTRLFFDRRVRLGAKLIVVAAIGYGLVRSDLLPDRSVIPGLIDDVLLIVVATRVLLMWSADEVVNAHAARALRWRRRVNF